MSAGRCRTARQRRANKALARIVIRSIVRQISSAAAPQRGRRHGRSRAVRSLGAGSLGALSIGAMSLGAGALGALAIGRLAIKRGTIGSLSIEELTVGRLRVDELEVLRDASTSTSPSASA